jgi:hypothetical protein
MLQKSMYHDSDLKSRTVALDGIKLEGCALYDPWTMIVFGLLCITRDIAAMLTAAM